MARLLRVAGLVVGGLVLGLVSAELVLRLVPQGRALTQQSFVESERGKFARYDPQLGWTGIPGASSEFVWPDARHHVRQNEYGQRGRAHPFERSDSRRLLVLGDSFAWGFGVEDDEIFTSRLEQGLDLEVVNTGVSGYGTDQELLSWRQRGHEWNPDEVLLLVTLYTDLWDNPADERYDYPKPHFERLDGGRLVLRNVPVPETDRFERERVQRDATWVPPVARWVARSALVQAVVQVVAQDPGGRRWLEGKRLIPHRRAGYDWEFPLYQRPAAPDVEDAWALLFGLAGELQREVESQGARLTVAVVPSIVQVYPEMWRRFRSRVPQAERKSMRQASPMQRVAAWCGERGVRFVNLLPDLREAGKTDPYLYFPINRHWTASGHAVVASTLSRAFSETAASSTDRAGTSGTREPSPSSPTRTERSAGS